MNRLEKHQTAILERLSKGKELRRNEDLILQGWDWFTFFWQYDEVGEILDKAKADGMSPNEFVLELLKVSKYGSKL